MSDYRKKKAEMLRRAREAPAPSVHSPATDVQHGDCLTLLRALPDASFDALVTDPPFGIGKVYAGKRETANSPEEYWTWLRERYLLALAKVRPGGFVAVWQTQVYFRHFWSWFGENIHVYAAAKNFVQLRKLTAINYGYDPVVMFYKSGAEPLRPIPAKRNLDFFVANTAAMVSKPDRIERRHPYPRPIDQVTEIVSNFVTPGGRVLDIFAGSGTTAVACRATGRTCLSMEENPEYVALINERLALVSS